MSKALWESRRAAKLARARAQNERTWERKNKILDDYGAQPGYVVRTERGVGFRQYAEGFCPADYSFEEDCICGSHFDFKGQR